MNNWDDVGDAIQMAIERASGLTTIWKDQNRNAPALDYVALSLSMGDDSGITYERISQDLTRPRGQEIKIETYSGQTECALEVEIFTAESVSARQLAALAVGLKIHRGMYLPSVKSILQKQAVAMFDYTPAQWIPDVPSTTFRGRAITTLSIYMRAPTVVEYVGYIERVRGRTIIHGTASGGSSGIAYPFDSASGATGRP